MDRVFLGLQRLGEDAACPLCMPGAQIGVAVAHRDHRRGDDGLFTHPVLVRVFTLSARPSHFAPIQPPPQQVRGTSETGLPVRGRWLACMLASANLSCEASCRGARVPTFGLWRYVLVSRPLRTIGQRDGHLAPIVGIDQVECVDHHEGGITQVRLLVGRTEAYSSVAKQSSQRLSQFDRPEYGVLTEELDRA